MEFANLKTLIYFINSIERFIMNLIVIAATAVVTITVVIVVFG